MLLLAPLGPERHVVAFDQSETIVVEISEVIFVLLGAPPSGSGVDGNPTNTIEKKLRPTVPLIDAVSPASRDRSGSAFGVPVPRRTICVLPCVVFPMPRREFGCKHAPINTILVIDTYIAVRMIMPFYPPKVRS